MVHSLNRVFEVSYNFNYEIKTLFVIFVGFYLFTKFFAEHAE